MRYLITRASKAWLVTWLLSAGALIVLSSQPVVIPIGFLHGHPVRWTPIWELIPSLLGVSTGAFLAPRLASWERLGVGRTRLWALATAGSAVILTASLPWINHFFLPPDARWLDITSNVLVFSAVGLITTAAVGPRLGAVIAWGSYGGFVVLSHAVPQLAVRLPLTGVIDNLQPHFTFSVTISILALALWSRSRGQTSLASRLQRNE